MKYLISVDVLRATGQQTYSIEAENEHEALKRWHAGEGEIVSEELEASDFGTPVARSQQ